MIRHLPSGEVDRLEIWRHRWTGWPAELTAERSLAREAISTCLLSAGSQSCCVWWEQLCSGVAWNWTMHKSWTAKGPRKPCKDWKTSRLPFGFFRWLLLTDTICGATIITAPQHWNLRIDGRFSGRGCVTFEAAQSAGLISSRELYQACCHTNLKKHLSWSWSVHSFLYLDFIDVSQFGA